MAISVPDRRRRWARVRGPIPVGTAASAERATASAEADRLDAAVVARGVVAAALFGAGAIHFGFAPDHFAQSRFHGAFFFLTGWVQLGLGLAVLLRPSRAVLRLVIAVNAGMIVLWAMSRLVGMPFGTDAWVPEAVGFPDVLATLLEVVAIVGGYLLLAGRLGARSLSRLVVVAGGAVLAVALVGGTTASVAPALAGGHSHGATGHVHQAGAAGHTHLAANGTGVAGATGAAARASGGGDHTHALGAAGIEAGNGTSPCEQSGVTVDGNASGHGHRGPSVQQAVTDPATRALLAEQLATARTAALRYPAAADATAAGYRRVTTYLPCIGAHYMNYSLVDGTFDPATPEMLLYDGNGPDARMVGLSYYVNGVTTAPEGFAGPNDPWHQHIGLCVRGGLVVGGSDLTAEECAARGGSKADGSKAWMVHAWVVPGWESAWGTFSGEHPELGTSVLH